MNGGHAVPSQPGLQLKTLVFKKIKQATEDWAQDLAHTREVPPSDTLSSKIFFILTHPTPKYVKSPC